MQPWFRSSLQASPVDALASALEAEQPRIDRLLRPRTDLDQEPHALREALESLRLHHEELAVAAEELRSQVDELTCVGLKLELERERYADLFALAPDAHVVTDRAGVIIEANVLASELFRVDRRFLPQKPLALFMSGRATDPLGAVLERVKKVARPVLESFRIRPRGGGEVAVDARVVMAARGTRLLWSFRAIPEEESSDAALERERSRARELERANRAKDRFMAVLAHDLRAPLNAIAGWAEIVREPGVEEKLRERAFAAIERGVESQTHLIEGVLDAARFAANHLELSISEVDLSAVVERVTEASIPLAKRNGIALSVRTCESANILGDSVRLEQVLTNLLSNAFKYTSSGGHVMVDVARDGQRVRVSVEDDGKGIASNLLPNVFNMYTQDHSEASARDGLGLGLHIVRELVALHDGDVIAESKGEGHGATFTVWFPCQAATSQTLPA